MMAIIDDAPKVLLAVLVTALAFASLWAVLDRWSRVGTFLRTAWSQASTRRALVAAIAVAVFAAIADDVLFDEHEESVLRFDRRVRTALADAPPRLHAAAVVASRLTGEGLALAAAAAIVGLVLARRRREAIVMALGGLGAWALSGGLKVMFLVPRPRAEEPMRLLTSYGFPSGHALVTLVIGGVLAWTLGQRVRRSRRWMLWTAVWGLALTAGAARVVLGAHWLSDAAAGLAVGVVWLSAVLIVAETWRPADGSADASALAASQKESAA